MRPLPGLGAFSLALLCALGATSATAQEPPDSLPPDVEAEDADAAADSVPPTIHDLPDFGTFGSSSRPWIRRWDLEDLLESPALTLQELLEPVAGIIPVRGGDFGAPENIIAVGMGAGRVRLFMDGVEEVPLDGSQVDFARIPLVGIGSVTLRRGGGELRIELETERADPDDDRPLTRISAGTGDLETNLFRGFFAHPNAFAGSFTVGIERIDTSGPGGADEDGTVQGVWLRYLRPIGGFTISGELRRGIAENNLSALGALESTRSTQTLRLRSNRSSGLRGEVYWSNTTVDLEDGLGLEGESVRDADLDRSQIGVRGAWEGALGSASLWVRGEARVFNDQSSSDATPRLDSILRAAGQSGGARLPDDRLDLDAGAEVDGLGGASVRLGTDGWDGERHSVVGLQLWTAAYHGVSAFLERDDGERGWQPPFLRLPTDSAAAEAVAASFAQDAARSTDRDFTRIGAHLARGAFDVEVAWLSTNGDSVLPLGTADRAGLVGRGGAAFAHEDATGFEIGGRVALPLLEGLSGVGSLQSWDEEGVYRPERIYRGGVNFARTFLESGNFEINASFLVEGRDAMLVPIADPDFVASPEAPDLLAGPSRVPAFRSWNAHLQIRIVTARIFIRWENALGEPGLQDLPGRTLPGLRAMWGVRWTLRN
ncbi:MAG: hypothetical protein RQ745_06040 [Longimicrobiales bacterium]|nr:hypothetical protein [Longimicrobiales bacterium]